MLNEQVEQILTIFKYYQASELKLLQTKFTKLAVASQCMILLVLEETVKK